VTLHDLTATAGMSVVLVPMGWHIVKITRSYRRTCARQKSGLYSLQFIYFLQSRVKISGRSDNVLARWR